MDYITNIAKDVIDNKVETPGVVCDRLLLAAEYIPLEHLGSMDNCGCSPFEDNTSTGRDTAFEKIRARVLGTQMAGRCLTTQQ